MIALEFKELTENQQRHQFIVSRMSGVVFVAIRVVKGNFPIKSLVFHVICMGYYDESNSLKTRALILMKTCN